MRDMVILVDLDHAACRTLARKLRAGQIYCKILPHDATMEDVREQDALGVLLAGGAKGEAAEIPQLYQLLECDIPLMAIGDAALTLCQVLGGQVGKKQNAGVVSVQFDHANDLLDDTESDERYLPDYRPLETGWDGSVPIAWADTGILGMRDARKPLYALALLPERNDPIGTQLLVNFCKNVCGCTLWWNNKAFVDRAIDEIHRAANGGSALCAISGGVDSGLCAVLGNMALGHQLHCVFVDTGLLREGEAEEVMHFYRDQMGLNVYRIDASDQVLTALKGVTSPAEKDKVISRVLQQLMIREVAMLPDVHLLIQGTTYSDQQVSAFPLDQLDKPVILAEPVRELFKDEIRRVAEDMGMPGEIIHRQPFPGSGLALRILTEVTEERLAILRAADAIFRREIEAANQHKRLWQYFAALALSPYPEEEGYVITLRAVQAIEGAAAMPARLPSDLLERVSMQIRSALPLVGRVMYDLTPSRTYVRTEGK